MSQKPRSDSKLKTLPDERQAQIIEMLRAKSLREVRLSLAEDGLLTSEASLSEFRSWWQLRQQFSQAEQFSEEMVELLKQSQPGLSQEALYAYGQMVFQREALAMQEADPEAASMIWYRMQRLRLKAKDQELLDRRIKLLEAEAAKAAKAEETLKDKELSVEQQQLRLKEIFGLAK